jgi:hypothetical protein
LEWLDVAINDESKRWRATGIMTKIIDAVLFHENPDL